MRREAELRFNLLLVSASVSVARDTSSRVRRAYLLDGRRMICTIGSSQGGFSLESEKMRKCVKREEIELGLLVSHSKIIDLVIPCRTMLKALVSDNPIAHK